MTSPAPGPFQPSIAVRLFGAALLVAAFLLAAAAFGRAGGSPGWADAVGPILCVAGAAAVLAIGARLGRRGVARKRSAAVRALHRELDAVADQPSSEQHGRPNG